MSSAPVDVQAEALPKALNDTIQPASPRPHMQPFWSFENP